MINEKLEEMGFRWSREKGVWMVRVGSLDVELVHRMVRTFFHKRCVSRWTMTVTNKHGHKTFPVVANLWEINETLQNLS